MAPQGAAEVRFRLVGVDCTSASCTLLLRRHLKALPGITDFYVNPMDASLTVAYDPERTTAEGVARAVRATGLRVIGPIMSRPRAPGPGPTNPAGGRRGGA